LDIEMRQRRFTAFERAVEIPMLALALLMLPLLLIPEFFDLSRDVKTGLIAGEWVIWSAFALELGVKTYLSPSRKQYLVSHWYDVVIVVVPFLRPLRIVRSLRLLRASRAMRLMSYGVRLTHHARAMVVSHGLHYATIIGAMLFFALAGLALLFERDAAGANIHTYGEAVWWGIATITTVGYGDRFPVTTEGRAVSVFLMLLGISLFSLITASIAAMFVSTGEKEIEAKEEATLADVLERLERMEARLVALQHRHPEDNGEPALENGEAAPETAVRPAAEA
jgi:voltage-gated potassium channel